MILFWANDVPVVRVFRCGLTCGMLSGERVLALIFIIMTGGLPKMVSNWVVLAVSQKALPRCAIGAQARARCSVASAHPARRCFANHYLPIRLFTLFTRCVIKLHGA